MVNIQQDINNNDTHFSERCSIIGIVILILLLIMGSISGIMYSAIHLEDGCVSTECVFQTRTTVEGYPYCIVTTKNNRTCTNFYTKCPSEDVMDCFYVPDAPQPWSGQFVDNRCYSSSCNNLTFQLGLTFSFMCTFILLVICITMIYAFIKKKR